MMKIIGLVIAMITFLPTTIFAETTESFSAHESLFVKDRFPSATECRTCHQQHYEEWSVSPHAYAQISPVFNAMQRATTMLTNGTNGDFCIRCHTPVGMALGESVSMPTTERHEVSMEGVTCIACHRQNKAHGKISGRFDMEEGDILKPVTGPTNSDVLEETIANPKVKVSTKAESRGRKIHTEVEPFFAMTTPQFCGACHDVNSIGGLRLEEAFSSYKTTESAERGETCQDCHMGKKPGVVSGYNHGPAAKVGKYETPDRKLTNHMFAGPDYSIVHPGIFPHNPDAKKLAGYDEWVQFDYKAGWGTKEFEATKPSKDTFPKFWKSKSKRKKAAKIIKAQKELLSEARKQQYEVLRAGYVLGDIDIKEADKDGVEFSIQVKNGTSGHNVPTGFIGERLVYLEVTVKDWRSEKIVFRSGDLDPNGDVRDSHSLYVHDGLVELDPYLYNLQSKFLTRNFRSGESESVLPINFSFDPVPFNRPSTVPTYLQGRPNGARIHRQSISPLGEHWAKYEVDEDELNGSEQLLVTATLYAQMVPVNLIHKISPAGFEYGLTPKEVAKRVVDGKHKLWTKHYKIDMREGL